MALVYPYVSDEQELLPRPLVNVTVIGQNDQAVLRALLDTGAEMVVLHESIVRKIGATLIPAAVGTCAGVTGEKFKCRFAAVTLELKSSQEAWRWQAKVAVTEAELVNPILGFAGCLQYFDAKFFGREYRVELDWNGSYKPPA